MRRRHLLYVFLLLTSGCAVSDSGGPGSGSGDDDAGPSDQGDGDTGGSGDTSTGDGGLPDATSDGDTTTSDLGEDSNADTPREDVGPNDVAPSIIRFSANRSEMNPGDSIVFTVIATDDNGLADLLGGVIEDDAGNEYGSLTSTGSEGSYSFELSWFALNEVEPVSAPPGGAQWTFVARVYDAAALEDTEELSVLMTCNAESMCGGVCADLDTDDDHCGECGEALPIGWDQCDEGAPACLDGREYCDTACVDILSSSTHCGSCEALPAGWDYCNDGEPDCYEGQTYCEDGGCVNLEANPDYCGSCDHQCNGDFYCGEAECRLYASSSDGNTTCDAVCGEAGTSCVEAVEHYGLRDDCTCSGVGCYEGELDCDQTPNSRLDFCEEAGSFTALTCICAEI